MLRLITKDDPPVFLSASDQLDGLRNRNEVNHTAKHSAAVRKRCEEVGETAGAAANPVEFALGQLEEGQSVQNAGN